MDADKFLQLTQSGGEGRKPKLAVVKSTPSLGLISVQFESSESTSAGGFAYLDSYSSPQIDDRVVMMPVGNTYVAIGKLSTS